jgi:iron complex outermembrane receptor protein
LINGKRTAPYGSPSSSVAVDVDSIPIAAIERVEILKDGASAIYGSDAIAGVVNFILRKDFKGFELGASYGAATKDGKGDVTKFSAVAGFGDISEDKFNVMLLGGYQKEKALYGRDRSFASTAVRLDKNNFGGSSRSFPGNVSIPGFGLFNPAVDPNTGVGDCGAQGVNVPDFGPICLFDTGPYVALIPETERYGLQVAGTLAINENAQLYADASFNHKKAQTVIQPSPIDTAFGIPFRVTTASPFYPTAFVQGITGGATPTVSIRFRPFIIGNRDLTDTAEATRLVIGAKGTVLGWDYDANLLRTTSQVTEQLNGGFFRINDEATGPGIEPLLSGLINGSTGQPLWVNPFGPNSAEVIAAARATNYVGRAFKTQTELNGAQGKVSKELMALGGGGLGIALGMEVRREGYKLDSAPALATGNISGYGGNFVSLDTKRSVVGVFAELDAPITKSLEFDAAVRYDRYGSTTNPLGAGVAGSSLSGLVSAPSEDTLPQSLIDQIGAESSGNAPAFGKATGKLGIRFEASPAFILRSTVSTGFRAPALLDLYGPVQAGVSAVQNDPKLCQGAGAGDANFCATQFNVYNGGNAKLKPEESRSLTLGFVAEPFKNFSIGIDYFDTEVKDLIGIQSSSYLLANEAAYQSQVTRGPSGEIIAIDQRLQNTGKVKIQGVDFDIRGSFVTPIGKLGLGWSATYMSKWDSQNPDGTWSGNIGTTSAAVSGFIPRFRNTTTANLNVGAWDFTTVYNWQSGARDVCGNLLQDDFGNCPVGSNPDTSAYETIDLQVKYAAFKGFVVAAGVRNLLDKDPPYVNGSGGAFQAGYDPTYVDPRGRFAYLNVNYKF